ncbi:hypothetical protein C0995_010568 [Termitomyces sp. Mi166|nr:hypothetical protein C0995_010568 [Termitomyces sp. Mi166\
MHHNTCTSRWRVFAGLRDALAVITTLLTPQACHYDHEHLGTYSHLYTLDPAWTTPSPSSAHELQLCESLSSTQKKMDFHIHHHCGLVTPHT